MKLNAMVLGLALLGTASVSQEAQATGSGYTQTQYPIVLVHGLFGFDSLAGVDYWYGIPSALSKDGAQVYVVNVSAANSTEVRGEQLLDQIQSILALTGAKKVNLIGHSHGGPTARYAASMRPDLVASVTSVGGVNWGSRFADAVRGTLPEGSLAEDIVAGAANGFSSIIEFLSGSPADPSDSIAALNSLTTADTVRFNGLYPEGMPDHYCGQGPMKASNGVYYFSWSGASKVTNLLDVSDAGLLATSLVFNEPNDGLVSSCSSHLGMVIRDNYGMNHLDEVNQAFGLVNLFETNPKTLYRAQANRLKNLGL
ncbi:triacylglycerol lipase [Gallaecimonas kandeliae]|uniref:esterase/lipase family protein n=1 Tax=Gallaecimonas kandeliae TaxID=3029055 RepID=UPI002647710B|nr:triacylglycerol lipase [Gallaecimonas kandeliae]WKE66226.1 triacylglycerol lipase [Gallaecimonas kandeliae]